MPHLRTEKRWSAAPLDILSVHPPRVDAACTFGLIEIHYVKVEAVNPGEVTARYTKEFCFDSLLLESSSFFWFRR
jgi:hypothetical protein